MKPKRKYNLSPGGLAVLQATAKAIMNQTGPRTEAGKAKSRFNAVKHGFGGKLRVLEGLCRRLRRKLKSAQPADIPALQAKLTDAMCQRHEWIRAMVAVGKVPNSQAYQPGGEEERIEGRLNGLRSTFRRSLFEAQPQGEG